MYDSLTVSLAAAIPEGSAASQITATGRPVGSFSVQRVTPGATFFFKIGNAQWIPVSSAFTFYGFDPLKEGALGVFIRNDTAQAGASFDCVVGFISDRDRAELESARGTV